MKHLPLVSMVILFSALLWNDFSVQAQEKLLITHSSESIRITPTAEETYRIMVQTLTEDGTMGDTELSDLLEAMKQEAGGKRAISVRDIVGYSLLRRAAR